MSRMRKLRPRKGKDPPSPKVSLQCPAGTLPQHLSGLGMGWGHLGSWGH